MAASIYHFLQWLHHHFILSTQLGSSIHIPAHAAGGHSAWYEEASGEILICISLKSNLSVFYVFIGHLYVVFAVSSLVFSWVFSFSCKIFFFFVDTSSLKITCNFFLLILFEAYFAFVCAFETGSQPRLAWNLEQACSLTASLLKMLNLQAQATMLG